MRRLLRAVFFLMVSQRLSTQTLSLRHAHHNSHLLPILHILRSIVLRGCAHRCLRRSAESIRLFSHRRLCTISFHQTLL